MKRINSDILLLGDIILTTSIEKPSGLIRAITSSDISHAMIYVSSGSVIDSTADGVHSWNVEKLRYPDKCAIHILRHDPPILESDIKKVIEYARMSVGTEYSMGEAVTSPFRNRGGTNKQYCSRLVARAYEAAGRILVDSPDFCSPEDLKSSSSLKLIDHPWLPAESGQTDSPEQEVDYTQGMRDVTNLMLKGVRKICPDVQTLEELVQASINQPELDKELADQLKESGFLTYWKTEVERYPWRYDEVLIVQFYHSLSDKSSLLKYCERTLDDEAAGTFNHWKEMRQALSKAHNNNPRRTLKLLLELYVNLILYHSKRLTYAKLINQTFG